MFVVAWKDKNGKQVVVDGKASWHLRFDRKNPGTGKREYIHETFHGSKRAADVSDHVIDPPEAEKASRN